MPSLTLPPRGVFVPTALVYARDLSPAAFHTWVQLRGLAWQDGQTPPCSVQDLSRFTGKSPSALYAHLAVLKSCGALRWRTVGKGTLVIHFDKFDEHTDFTDLRVQPFLTAAPSSAGDSTGQLLVTEPESNFVDSKIPEPGFQDSRIPASDRSSSLHLINQNIDSKKGLNEMGKLQHSVKSKSANNRPPAGDHPVPSDVVASDGVARDGVARDGVASDGVASDVIASDVIASDVIAIYRSLTGRRPNQTQRLELLDRVTDPDLWRRTLAHWQVHGWNPCNLAGLLDLYQRGGPQACRYCARPEIAANLDPIDQLIADLRNEADHDRSKRNRRRPENFD